VTVCHSMNTEMIDGSWSRLGLL